MLNGFSVKGKSTDQYVDDDDGPPSPRRRAGVAKSPTTRQRLDVPKVARGTRLALLFRHVALDTSKTDLEQSSEKRRGARCAHPPRIPWIGLGRRAVASRHAALAGGR